MRRLRRTRAIVLAILLAGAAFAPGAAAESLLLVATPKLNHPLYSRTVVVNRPLDVQLARLFPQHEPSRKVKKLVDSERAPGGGCIEMTPGLFAVMHHKTVDRVIESNPGDARYFAGMVVWRPGELARELAGRGARRSRLHWTHLPAGRPLSPLPR